MFFNKMLSSKMLRVLMIFLATLLLPNLGLAQDGGQSSGQSSGQTAGQGQGPGGAPAGQDASKKTDDSNGPAPQVGLEWANSYVHQIGSSGLLAGNREGIGWGSLYIPSASVTGVVERFEGTTTLPGATFDAAIFQTSVVYDHMLGRTTRLAIQYAPSMAIANGQVVGNFSNQNTSIDLLLYSRPRLNIRFDDTFSYYYAQQSFGFSYFDVNPSTSTTVTNAFLNGSNSWLSDSAYMSIAYAISPRSSITVAPSFIYSQSEGGTNRSHADSYGGNVNWNYRLSERQTIGVAYNAQWIHEDSPGNSSTPIGTASDTIYHSIALTAARQLSATWVVRGSAGVTTSSYSQTGQNLRGWSFYGSGEVVKQIGRRSSIGVNYSRGDTLSNGLISNEYADRVDISFRSELTKRLHCYVGGGYLKQVQSGGFSGWYSSGDLQFLLAPRNGIFAFFDFNRTQQSANTANLYQGNTDYFSFGLRWQPGRIVR
jgi:hypothetical protein